MAGEGTRDEQIRSTALSLGVSLARAEFIVAIARGEIPGDVVTQGGGESP